MHGRLDEAREHIFGLHSLHHSLRHPARGVPTDNNQSISYQAVHTSIGELNHYARHVLRAITDANYGLRHLCVYSDAGYNDPHGISYATFDLPCDQILHFSTLVASLETLELSLAHQFKASDRPGSQALHLSHFLRSAGSVRDLQLRFSHTHTTTMLWVPVTRETSSEVLALPDSKYYIWRT